MLRAAVAAIVSWTPIVRCLITACSVGLIALLGSSVDSLAKPKRPIWSATHCFCICGVDIQSGTGGVYDHKGLGCFVLEGKTCNREDPDTGIILTGKLSGCSQYKQGMFGESSGQLLDPGTQGSTRPRVGSGATGGVLTPGQ